LANKILGHTSSPAAVQNYGTIIIHGSQLHAGRLHLGIGETHLHVDIIDGLQEIAEIPSRRANHLVVAEVTKEADETSSKEVHAEVEGLTSARR